MDIDIKHDEINKRFYIELNGNVCELKYKKIDDHTLDYYRTFVPEALGNQGLAAKITKYALDYARKNHYQIVPTCSYVKAYLKQHPEYADLAKSSGS
jgi:predicted GNAT family acetyltransferase